MKSTHYIPRDIEPALRQAVKQFPSILITGPRQSGKTRLSVQLFSKTHKYVTFDDIKIRGLAIKDPELFLEKFQPPLIIDEIQYAPQILPYIKMSIDTDRDSGGKFILTGSQQFALMQNVTESLAGRVGMLTLLPMS
ncbi:MAG: AAA family ATPase, partial [Elusimicrobia bacterium]|nr:AAA family ATPase [Elusimicrobiota bacterium]